MSQPISVQDILLRNLLTTISFSVFLRAINIGLLRQSSSILSATEYVPISYSPADFLVVLCFYTEVLLEGIDLCFRENFFQILV